MTSAVPVADGVFTWPSDSPQLIGARCTGCEVTTFPRQDGCPRCAGTEMRDVLLPRRGTLWTFTTQEFLPKNPPYGGTETPEQFRPYGVGYVELPGACRVEGRLTGCELSELRIGQPMELVVEHFRTTPDGTPVLTFAFRPIQES